jgi:hypothetical protein
MSECVKVKFNAHPGEQSATRIYRGEADAIHERNCAYNMCVNFVSAAHRRFYIPGLFGINRISDGAKVLGL